jgi:hypothetical protein
MGIRFGSSVGAFRTPQCPACQNEELFSVLLNRAAEFATQRSRRFDSCGFEHLVIRWRKFGLKPRRLREVIEVALRTNVRHIAMVTRIRGTRCEGFGFLPSFKPGSLFSRAAEAVH